MAEENYEEFDSNVNFEDDMGQAPAEEEMADEMPQPQQPVQRARPRPPQRRRQPQPVTPQMAVAQAAPMPQQMPAQQQAIQQANPTAAPQARYIPYEMPKRIGLLDRASGKPVIEDEDMLRVVMAQLADIKNDLEEIKSYYS
jgi:hypothetical protein